MGEMLVVGSKVKAYIKSKGCHTSSDALGALSAKVEGILDTATERCKGNKRSTVKPQDL
jgi:histone H3/H4